MQGQDSPVCDACGSTKIARRWEGQDWCIRCFEKRMNWDEGARAIALRGVGFAVMLAQEFGADRRVIETAVDIAFSGAHRHTGLTSEDGFALGARNTLAG